jgi:VWFA-related protein
MHCAAAQQSSSRPARAPVALPPAPAPAPEAAQQDVLIRTDVTEVVAPVTVRDSSDRFVNGIEAREFTLLDNGKPQDIKLGLEAVPLSLVVAVQANSSVEHFLPQIRMLGPLLEGLVVGASGEAAIVAFDHRIRTIQGFTNDGRLFKQALEKVTAGSTSKALVDTVYQSVRMLAARPKDRRKIILLISETRDRGSEGSLREALLAAQFQNIIIYSINVNRLIARLTEKSQPPRWDHLPAGSRPRLPGAPLTPTAQAQATGIQGYSANFMPLVIEMFTQVKSIFFDNPIEVLTHYTGGREYSFLNTGTFEKAVADLGEELQSHYLLTYSPNNQMEGGWHEILVRVARFDLKVRTRPGYWMAAKPR